MAYLYSQIDRSNLNWFQNDGSNKSLKTINLKKGKLRGLYSCSLNLSYPISAIAGKNGSGKSTLLAMACCAYHNRKDGYTPIAHNKTYYTFSDFFVGTTDEEKVEGIEIEYSFLVNLLSSRNKVKSVTKTQIRKKKTGGRWNDYDLRYKRDVVFSGIQRIVPPSERKTERTYSDRFESTQLNTDTKSSILGIASSIFGKMYTELDLRMLNNRRLFVVDRETRRYSGFNMGAGENAVFSLLIELFTAKRGALLVIDEIELGLHEQAQRKLIEELKIICNNRKCQVICSTHSAAILSSLPPEGRFYVDPCDQKTEIIPGISSEYAMGKLSGIGNNELTVYVEDKVGQLIVRNSLPGSIRERVSIIPIGSDQAVLRQLSARYRDNNCNCIAFLDGDKKSLHSESIRQFMKCLEDRYSCSEREIRQWIDDRLNYLPGEIWPEAWVVQNAAEQICSDLALLWRINEDKAHEYCQAAVVAGKHKEFYRLSMDTSQDETQIINDIVRCLNTKVPKEFKNIETKIAELLE